jgi:predicted nucleic acid-binding protein
VYLSDTKVISEARKRAKANRGVRRFFNKMRTAATALIHDLILVARNADHFKGLEVRLFNPFD